MRISRPLKAIKTCRKQVPRKGKENHKILNKNNLRSISRIKMAKESQEST